MTNMLPGVELSGEHDAELVAFMNLQQRMKKAKSFPSEAWVNKNQWQLDSEIYCLAQDWLFLHTGRDCGSESIHGFKEIRYNDRKSLDFIVRAFPNSKIVINYRRNVTAQSNSGFYKKYGDGAKELVNKTSFMLDWASSHPDRARPFALEDFSPDNFTLLFAWLGFPHCYAVSLLHLNKHNKYSRTTELDGGLNGGRTSRVVCRSDAETGSVAY